MKLETEDNLNFLRMEDDQKKIGYCGSHKRMESRFYMSGIKVVRDTLVPELYMQAVGLLLSQLMEILTCCTYSWVQWVSLVILSIMVGSSKMLPGLVMLCF